MNAPMDQPPTGHMSTRRLVPYFLITACMSFGYGSIYTLLADLRKQMGFTPTQLGVVVAAGFFAGFVAQVGLARFADRGHAAIMVRVGVSLAALAMLASAVTDELWGFILGRAVLGLGSGMVAPAIRRIVITQDPAQIGANLGRQGSFDVAGFVLGPLVAAVLKELGNLRTPFYALFFVYSLMLVAVFRLDLTATAQPSTDTRIVRSLLKLSSVRGALYAATAFYITIGMFEAVWALILSDLGAETWLIGVTLSAFTVPMVFLAPYGGRVAQAYGPLRIASLTIFAAALCTLSYGFLPLWPLMLVGLAHAVADSYTMPAAQVAVAVASPPEHIAAGQGLLGATGVAVAGAVGGIGGAVYDQWGRFTLTAGTAGLMLVFLALSLHAGKDLRQAPAADGSPAAVASPSTVSPQTS